ncbi:MAG TPA: hypothetical protein VNA14_12540 [Mycobacteriales bacterium]|nr:hypothetical protein [Mycobacteriales bacterium]
MDLDVSEPRRLGGDAPRITFGTTGPESRSAGLRALFLDGEPAYEQSFPCGTCGFLFRRLQGAADTLSVDELRDRLTTGLDTLDDEVVTSFGQLVERGTYVPLLLTVEPRLVTPGGPGDYFAEEQVATWGLAPFWGLPEHPRTAYYRTFETAVGAKTYLYEFVVPMLAPAEADPEQVAAYAERLASSPAPTAVAVATLDVCAPAVERRGLEWQEHWGLTHFLLDGHHKVQAAALTRRPVRLLSLLSLDASLVERAAVDRLPALRRQPRAEWHWRT